MAVKRDLLKRLLCILLLVVFCFTQSGCASLLKVPLTLVQLPFIALGKVLGFVSKMPKPPPWVFF